jgi:hypothetical protein
MYSSTRRPFWFAVKVRSVWKHTKSYYFLRKRIQTGVRECFHAPAPKHTIHNFDDQHNWRPIDNDAKCDRYDGTRCTSFEYQHDDQVRMLLWGVVRVCSTYIDLHSTINLNSHLARSFFLLLMYLVSSRISAWFFFYPLPPFDISLSMTILFCADYFGFSFTPSSLSILPSSIFLSSRVPLFIASKTRRDWLTNNYSKALNYNRTTVETYILLVLEIDIPKEKY